ncbi:MAG: hypothetical protein IPN83_09035 [Holophagales bacterium]|nr:hypothetical protein [Holophagales bacterium]
MKNTRVLALLLFLTLSANASLATEVLIPNVVAFVRGANDSFWGTEIRVINPTTAPKSFRVVDWIGSPRARRFSSVVGAGETLVVGGWELYADWDAAGGFAVSGQAEYGAAVCEAEEGLIVLSRTLTSTVRGSGGIEFSPTCSGNSGGYWYERDVYPFFTCNWGVGPMLYADRSFFAPGRPQNLLMLNPRRNHYRTNLVIVNGDPQEASVTVEVLAAAGKKATLNLKVPGKTYYQLNDIYALPELEPLETASEDIRFFGQRAVVTCSTRCFAIAYAIASDNNTVSIVEPR